MQLAEVGVMLLMFGVGLHFSHRGPARRCARVAVPGRRGADGSGHRARRRRSALAWGWSLAAALVFGLALSVASTVVLLRALEARGALETPERPHRRRLARGRGPGHGAGAGAAAGAGGLPAADACSMPRGMRLGRHSGVTLLEVAAFVAVMLVAGRRACALGAVAGRRAPGRASCSRLCVVALAIGIAFACGAALFGVSWRSAPSSPAWCCASRSSASAPPRSRCRCRDAFAVLFFVSVGMLFDPAVLIDRPLQVLRPSSAIVVLGKSLAAGGCWCSRCATRCARALTVSGQPGADRRVLLGARDPGPLSLEPAAARGHEPEWWPARMRVDRAEPGCCSARSSRCSRWRRWRARRLARRTSMQRERPAGRAAPQSTEARLPRPGRWCWSDTARSAVRWRQHWKRPARPSSSSRRTARS
jgi:hypothetical protein